MVFVSVGQKAQDKKSFFKVTPLIWAIEDQNNKSYRGGVGPSKKEEKFPLFEKFPTKGGVSLDRSGWFPIFYQFLILKSSIIYLVFIL